MSSKSESATYIHGHHASVLRSHTWRNVANSAAYIVPYLKPAMRILDIGCGPGTVTVDLAGHVPEGHVTGLDRAGEIILQARALAKEKGVNNVDFVEGDANALDYADDTFDIVICHQVLQHVHDPIAVLREMRRVTRLDGITAAREADYGSFSWYPAIDGMEGWLTLYERVARAGGGEPDAGRMIHAWAKKAGFATEDIACNSSTWCYSTKEEVTWWSDLWAERILASNFASTAIEKHLATQEDLDRMAEIWRRWGAAEDAWFSLLLGEVVCRKRLR